MHKSDLFDPEGTIRTTLTCLIRLTRQRRPRCCLSTLSDIVDFSLVIAFLSRGTEDDFSPPHFANGVYADDAVPTGNCVLLKISSFSINPEREARPSPQCFCVGVGEYGRLMPVEWPFNSVTQCRMERYIDRERTGFFASSSCLTSSFSALYLFSPKSKNVVKLSSCLLKQ